MFKIGDRIRFLQDYTYRALSGDEGVVLFCEQAYEKPAEQLVRVKLDKDGSEFGVFDYRIELIAPAPEPVVTDEELADEYRDHMEKGKVIVQTMKDRGYTMRLIDGKYTFEKHVSI